MEIQNPYLKEFAALVDEKPMWAGEIVGKKRFTYLDGKHIDHRHELVVKYAWSVPTCEVIHALSERHKRIVEIGAGTGYWAWLLTQAGVDILAYDVNPPTKHRNMNHYKHSINHVPVRKGTHKVLKNHADRTLMLCWPPYCSPMASKCLEAFRGDKLIYIGEGHGGCTANDTFFDMINKYWVMTHEHDLPQWDGIHDYVAEFERL